jgi:hypothetical protein
MKQTHALTACRISREPRRHSAKSDSVYTPDRRSGPVISTRSTTYPAAAPMGSQSMSAP